MLSRHVFYQRWQDTVNLTHHLEQSNRNFRFFIDFWKILWKSLRFQLASEAISVRNCGIIFLLMSIIEYNQSKAIASVLCPYLREGSPKTPYGWRPDRDAEYEELYQFFLSLGGRKALFERKRDYVVRSMIFGDGLFEATCHFIELAYTSSGGTITFWTGAGQFKEKGNYFGRAAILQIDITRVWDDISPFLEAVETRQAERQKEEQEVIAMFKRLRAQIPVNQSPNDSNSSTFFDEETG